jgi:hypothetical protein
MKLLHLCLAAAITAGVMAGPHVAIAQALGEAGALGAGLSSVGSASGSALSNGINRTMSSEGRRINSSGSNSNSGGVTNLHWSRSELERSAKTTRTQAKGKKAKARNGKPQPEFVIFGADPPNADSEDAPVVQPRAAHPSSSQPKSHSIQPKESRDKNSSRPGKKNVIPAGH